jgi:hypothetical protein
MKSVAKVWGNGQWLLVGFLLMHTLYHSLLRLPRRLSRRTGQHSTVSIQLCLWIGATWVSVQSEHSVSPVLYVFVCKTQPQSSRNTLSFQSCMCLCVCARARDTSQSQSSQNTVPVQSEYTLSPVLYVCVCACVCVCGTTHSESSQYTKSSPLCVCATRHSPVRTQSESSPACVWINLQFPF